METVGKRKDEDEFYQLWLKLFMCTLLPELGYRVDYNNYIKSARGGLLRD